MLVSNRISYKIFVHEQLQQSGQADNTLQQYSGCAKQMKKSKIEFEQKRRMFSCQKRFCMGGNVKSLRCHCNTKIAKMRKVPAQNHVRLFA